MPDGSASAHHYRPKLVTVLSGGLRSRQLSKGYAGGADGCDCRSPALDGDRRRLGRVARAGIIRRRHRRLFSIGAGRQPLSDRRSRRRVHRPRRGHRGEIRPRRTVADGFHLRLHADADRPFEARLADPLYSPCGDRRLHLRHRGHDLCQPAQGSRRLETACRRTRAVVAKARRARPGVADAQSCCARRRHWLGRPDLPAAAPGAELAGNVDRGRPGLGRRLAVPSAGGDDRQPFWPASGRPAGAASA